MINTIICESEKHCTSSKYCCKTCLRNKANVYDDKFSMAKEGYNLMGKWDIKKIYKK